MLEVLRNQESVYLYANITVTSGDTGSNAVSLNGASL